MSIVVLRKPENVLSGTTEQVVIGDATRTIDSLQRDADSVVQDITGWSASIIGRSDDLPGVFFDVPGEIVAPASAGVFRWTRVGDFLTEIGEKSRARFTCQVRTVDAAGLVGYGAEFGLDFVVPASGEDTNMNETAVLALIDERYRALTLSNNYIKLLHTAALPAQSKGFRSSGWTESVWSGVRAIGNLTAPNKAFNFVWNYVTDPVVFPHPGMSQTPMLSVPFEYRMVMNAATMAATPTGECYQGIQFGHFGVSTPWSGREDQLTEFGATHVLQLRHNFTRQKWEIVVWTLLDQEGNVPLISVTDCIIQPPFTPDLYLVEACLKYEPAPNGGSVLSAYLNGIFAGSVNNDTLQAMYGADTEVGPGYFVTTGTTTGQTIGDAIFFTGHFYQPWQDVRA